MWTPKNAKRRFVLTALLMLLLCFALYGIGQLAESMGRKNFLFANTPSGAQGSAVIYSIIETAKENGLDPFRYLTHILSTAPALALSDPDWAETLTPEFAPASCRSLQPRAQS